MFNFFEQPWTLLGLAIIVLPVVLMIRRIFPDNKRWWQLALPVFIAVLGFSLDYFIKTDNEKINSLLMKSVKAVETQNPLAIAPLVADDYQDTFHRSKKSLILDCQTWFSEPLVYDAIIRTVSIEITPPRATHIFMARVIIDKRSYVYEYRPIVSAKVKMDFRKQNKDWFITSIEILEIDNQPFKWALIRSIGGF